MSKDWTQDEVELVVADYFAMLRAELQGRGYDKAGHNRRLRPRLRNRSRGSVEFKHQNISAVLVNFDLPYIDGYKPRQNYQSLLERVVLERLAIDPDFFDEVSGSPVFQPVGVPSTDFSDLAALVEDPPEAVVERAPRIIEYGVDGPARRVDFVRQDAENRRVGRLGEEWGARELEDTLQGALSSVCRLMPTQFSARVGR